VNALTPIIPNWLVTTENATWWRPDYLDLPNGWVVWTDRRCMFPLPWPVWLPSHYDGGLGWPEEQLVRCAMKPGPNRVKITAVGNVPLELGWPNSATLFVRFGKVRGKTVVQLRYAHAVLWAAGGDELEWTATADGSVVASHNGRWRGSIMGILNQAAVELGDLSKQTAWGEFVKHHMKWEAVL